MGLSWSQRDAIARDEKSPGSDGIARSAMIVLQLALGPLLVASAFAKYNERISIRDAGLEWAAQRTAKQPAQVRMEESARRRPVADLDNNQSPAIPLPRPPQPLRPGKPAQVRDGYLVNGLAIEVLARTGAVEMTGAAAE
jgi:hypothetical protein